MKPSRYALPIPSVPNVAALPVTAADAVLRDVVDDGDGNPALYRYDVTVPGWIKLADPDASGVVLPISIANGGTGQVTAVLARDALGLEIGVDIASQAAVATAQADATSALANAATALTAANEADDTADAAQTTADGKQPLHANLTTLAGLASVAHLATVAAYSSIANLTAWVGLAGLADKIAYFTGAGALALADFPAAARTFLAATTAAAQRTVLGLQTTRRVFHSDTTETVNGFTLIADRAYFVYLGRVTDDVTIKFVEAQLSAVGVGVQVLEVGLFSTPLPPNKTSQSITKLVADGTIDDITSGLGTKRNTTAFNAGAGQVIPAGTHLWAGMRSNITGTQPGFRGLICDYGTGRIMSDSGAGPLTDAGPWTGDIIASTSVAVAPSLLAVSD